MESSSSYLWSILGNGIGIGCGVGWGPGFGPEVIWLCRCRLRRWFLVLLWKQRGRVLFELFGKNLSTDIMPQIAGLQRQVSEMCSVFNKKPLSNNEIDIKSFPFFIPHECGRFGSHILHLCKGLEDKSRGDSSPRGS